MGRTAGKLPAVLSAVQLPLLLPVLQPSAPAPLSDEVALRWVLFGAPVAACLVLSAGVQPAVLLQLSALLAQTAQPARIAQSLHAEQPAARLVLLAAV